MRFCCIEFHTTLWVWKVFLLIPRLNLSTFARFLTGMIFTPAQQSEEDSYIDHGMGVVIGETTEIGDDCLFIKGLR